MILLRTGANERILNSMGKVRCLIGALIACALNAPLIALPSAAHSALDATEPIRIMFVGDSITHGESGHATWRYRLWKRFQRAGQIDEVDFVGPRSDLFGGHGKPTTHRYSHPGFDQDHASVWGASFSRYAVNMGVESTVEMLQDYAPDVILLQLGVNDLTWGGLRPRAVSKLARDFVADARVANPHVDIVIGEQTPMWDKRVTAYNAVLPALVADLDTEASDVVLADQSTHVREVDTYDQTHPSASGEVKIADAYVPALVELGVMAAPRSTSPPRIRIGRPRVRAKAAKRRVLVRWSRAKNATRYVVKYRRVGHRWQTDRTKRRKWSKRVRPGHYVVRVKGKRGKHTGKADAVRVRVRR